MKFLDQLLAQTDRFLRKASEDEYLYHVTFYRNLESISGDGLLPGGGGGMGASGGYGEHSRGRVFLTSKSGVGFWYSKCEAWAENRSDNIFEDGMVPVVLRVSPNEEEEEDELGSSDAAAEAYFTQDGIDPDDIEVWNGTDWLPVSGWESINLLSALTVENTEGEDGEEGETLYWFKSSNPLENIR